MTAVPISGLPPAMPLVTDVVHVLGWVLLVLLVTLPTVAVAADGLREAARRARERLPRGGGCVERLCHARA